MEIEVEQITLVEAYVQKSDTEENKFEVLCQMHSNWAGNYWALSPLFDTEEQAKIHKSSLLSECK